MIAIRRLAGFELHLDAPSWTHILRRASIPRYAERDDMSRVERAAMNEATRKRAEALRITTERRWNGLSAL